MTAPDAAHEARERIDLGGGYFLRRATEEETGDTDSGLFCIGMHGADCLAGWMDLEQTRAFAAAMQAREARISKLEAALEHIRTVDEKPPRQGKDGWVSVYGLCGGIANAALATASQSEPTS